MVQLLSRLSDIFTPEQQNEIYQYCYNHDLQTDEFIKELVLPFIRGAFAAQLNMKALEMALRDVVAHMDYDLSKSVANVYGEHEEDDFPHYAVMLAEGYDFWAAQQALDD